MRISTLTFSGIVTTIAFSHSAFALQNGRSVIVDGQSYEQTRCVGRVSGFVSFSQEIWIRADQRHEAEKAFRKHLETFGRQVHEYSCESAAYSDDDITQMYTNQLSDWTGGFPTRPPEPKQEQQPEAVEATSGPLIDTDVTETQEPALARTDMPKAADSSSAPDAKPAWQVKYERELEEYRQAVKLREARLKEIEDIKAKGQRELEAARTRTERALQAHEAEMQRAAEAERAYEKKLQEHREILAARQGASGSDDMTIVDWREAVAVCSLDPNNPQSNMGNWKCSGPLQFTYAKLGEDGTAIDQKTYGAISLSCGGDAASVRYLGQHDAYRVFGCGYGLHPERASSQKRDMAARFGIGYVKDRAIYRCPRSESSCRAK